jgi:tetratricopeptide (TPR) repeat protein
MSALPASASAVPAAPSALKPSAAPAGDSGSTAALARLNEELRSLRAQAIIPILEEALERLRVNDFKGAAEWALKALGHDERFGYGWYVLAIAREKAGDLSGAVQCYETARALLPDELELANDLGRIAHRVGLYGVAEKLFQKHLLRNPGSVETVNNLACAIRDQLRYDDAVEILRPLIYAEPQHPMLWNTLGTVLSERGDMDQAVVFFDEALRLDPEFAKARYNRGNTRLALGDPLDALADVERACAAAASPEESAMMNLARSTILMACGRSGEGWDAYEARMDPRYVDGVRFLVDRPRWSPEDPLPGRSLLVIGEQGLGDEVMFANVLPEVIEALGPDGRLSLAVEPRLVPLFRRSFPTARVEAHGTFQVGHQIIRTVAAFGDFEGIDAWTPIASLLRGFRREPGSFPDRARYLSPDPSEVSRWRAAVAGYGPGLKVGVLWKSLKLDSGRSRYFSPFERWAPVLTTPGVTFVNLQYGECAAELAQAQAELGVRIVQPDGIDLKNDLDEVAALTTALDLVLGPANATTNIAAACGAPVWLISPPGVWPMLGTEHYPWYPNARVFSAAAYNDWSPVMAEVAAALAERSS